MWVTVRIGALTFGAIRSHLKEIKDSDQRAAFIRAKITDDGIIPEDKQDSGMMISFAGGDALIYVPKETTHMAKDEMVEVHLLPFGIA